MKSYCSASFQARISPTEVHEFLKPEQAPADHIAAFILNYTERASRSVVQAVNSALQELRGQYIN